MSSQVEEALKNLDNIKERLKQNENERSDLKNEFMQAENAFFSAKYNELMHNYQKNGLPRVIIDDEIQSVDEFVRYSLGRYQLMIPRDNATSAQSYVIKKRNERRYSLFKASERTFLGRLLHRIGIRVKPESMEEIWTIEGSQGQCERITVYPGLTDEQVKEMRR